MPHRALAASAAPTALLLAILLAAADAEVTCIEDGLQVDYESGCGEYVRCAGGAAVARYACEPGRAFSRAAGACVPRALQPCVRRLCAPGDRSSYASPGTACREYYRCDNGTAREYACPPGAWFDSERSTCARDAGACYEPLCSGLTDGSHADPSHDCRRRLQCRGGELRGVAPCADGAARCPPAPARCAPPRSAAVALPVGDADGGPEPCRLAEDGAHPDRSLGCREYYVCAARRLVRRGACDAGRLFSGAAGRCAPAADVECPRPTRGRCFGRADGAHRDWRDCRSWYACRREREVARGSCERPHVWDGAACVAPDRYRCDGPEPSAACAVRPSGFYQDLDANCARYFHCDGAMRTDFSCTEGQLFDGAACVRRAAYLCPSLDGDSCYGKPDGRYRARGSGCRGYYACAAGVKSLYACAAGRVFSASERACVEAGSSRCEEEDPCAALPDGYHRDEGSGCRDYFYCERSERIATLTCFGSKLFDGRRCVEPERYACGAAAAAEGSGRGSCSEDGFTVEPSSGCRSYSFCIGGERTALSCPRGQLFNGQVCVPQETYSCPGG